MKIAAWVGMGLLWPLWAQAPETAPAPKPPGPAVLTNSGGPMRVAFQCTDEEIQWAGMSCSEEEPCPIYLELSALEPVGNRIFTAGNIHSESVTLYSVLLASDDGGRTWQEPYDRMRGTVLDHIQFLDLESGWISGQVLVPVSQDPFLLITGDSGKTWRKRPIFEENRAGSIAQFWFSSRSNGALLIDRSQSGETTRYELYETQTGGESWSVREVSEKPIRLKHTLTPNTDWRIRADAPSKSFRIEKRQGEKWVTLASFLVPIAACKPKEQIETPPAQTTPEEAPRPAEPTAPPKPKPAPSLKRPK